MWICRLLAPVASNSAGAQFIDFLTSVMCYAIGIFLRAPTLTLCKMCRRHFYSEYVMTEWSMERMGSPLTAHELCNRLSNKMLAVLPSEALVAAAPIRGASASCQTGGAGRGSLRTFSSSSNIPVSQAFATCCSWLSAFATIGTRRSSDFIDVTSYTQVT